MYANKIRQNHTAVLQLSYREIFIFLNIPSNDLTGSFNLKNFNYFICSLTWPDSYRIVLSGRIRHLKNIIGRTRIFEVARTRKLGECGSDDKLLWWLAFLPSLGFPFKTFSIIDLELVNFTCTNSKFILLHATIALNISLV